MILRHRIVALIALIVLSVSATAMGQASAEFEDQILRATIERVVDGDTIKVILEDESVERVRLIGIDTPETVHPSKPVEPWGPEASAFTSALLPEGSIVYLELDVEQRDRYGRLLAYVRLNDHSMVQCLLLAAGLAQVSTYPPNVRYVDLFVLIQQASRAAGIGMWSEDPYEDRPEAPEDAAVTMTVNLYTEEVVITNVTDEILDLSGWRILSIVGEQEFVFPEGTVLEPGESISVTSGKMAREDKGDLIWTKGYIWNNDGDPGKLIDRNGNVVAATE
jgi:endonuclease YncB( thermonuclease family)